jgi:hypothetical protein
MAAIPELTPAQSAARQRELEAEGYDVERFVQPDGSVVVTKSRATDWGWVLCIGLGLVGCWAASSRGRGAA